MACFGCLGNQPFDVVQARCLAAVFARQVHHYQELVAALVQCQHLEFVAGRQHPGPHHGVAHHGIQLLAALQALVSVLLRHLGSDGGGALHGGIGVQACSGQPRLARHGQRGAFEPVEQ